MSLSLWSCFLCCRFLSRGFCWRCVKEQQGRPTATNAIASSSCITCLSTCFSERWRTAWEEPGPLSSETSSTHSFTISTAGWCTLILTCIHAVSHILLHCQRQTSLCFSLILRSVHCDEVSNRSLSLCCDLLTSVCRAALQFCDDALDCHLQVIVGTLTAQVTSRPSISQQVSYKSVNIRTSCLASLQIQLKWCVIYGKMKTNNAVKKADTMQNHYV